MTLRALVTVDPPTGIVIFLHGWWASRIGGSSANALTPDTLANLGGGSAMHDTRVEVERHSSSRGILDRRQDAARRDPV